MIDLTDFVVASERRCDFELFGGSGLLVGSGVEVRRVQGVAIGVEWFAVDEVASVLFGGAWVRVE
jgi:hypothetical protein